MEPWRAVEGEVFIKSEEGWGSIVDAQDWFIAKLEDSSDPAANASRIVACVNALRGLEPSGVAGVVEALEACIQALTALRSHAGTEAHVGEALDRAQAALAGLRKQ